MKPAAFEYFAPETLAEALELLEQHNGEARLLAGGQSLMPLLNMRLARPGVLVDLRKLAELQYIREVDGALATGAMTPKRAVERSDLVARRQPLLHQATLLIGHPQIRNRGTVGGSMAQADPAAEYPAVAVALDATLHAVGARGERSIDAANFFVTYLTTALEPGEVLTEVRWPALGERTGVSIQELTRRHGDFALAGAALRLSLDARGRCADLRIVVFGVGPVPMRARGTEQLISGELPAEPLFERASREVLGEIDEPLSDVHASADYRRHLAGVLVRRALAEAAARAAEAC